MNDVIEGVVRSEKAVYQASENKTIMFIVNIKATKPQIKEAIEKLFNKKVKKIRTQINFKGKKIVYVKFADDVDVEELASTLGVA